MAHQSEQHINKFEDAIGYGGVNLVKYAIGVLTIAASMRDWRILWHAIPIGIGVALGHIIDDRKR